MLVFLVLLPTIDALYPIMLIKQLPFTNLQKRTHNLCGVKIAKIRTPLTQTPVLAYPSQNDHLVLDTDASNYGMGAVLSQIQDDSEKVVCFFGKSFSGPERNYCVTRRELLAIVMSIKHFHHYLYGRRFTVRTDHGALRWLLNFKNLRDKRQNGWKYYHLMTLKLYIEQESLISMQIVSIGILVLALNVNIATTL